MKKLLNIDWIRNTLIAMLQRFSGTIFGFVNFMILARNLKPAQLGIWSLFMIIIITFEMSKSSLLKNAHIRFINSSQENSKENIAWTSLFINLICTILFGILIILLSGKLSIWLNTGDELSTILILYLPGLFSMIFFSHYEAVLQSYSDFKGTFIGSLIKQSLFLGFLFYDLLQKNPFELKSMVIYYTIGNLISTIFMFLYGYRNLTFKLRFSLEWVKKFMNYGSYLLGAGILSNISANIDQFLTSKYLNPFYVSYYSTSSRIVGVIDIPMNAVTQVLFPKISKVSYLESIEKVNYYLERSIGYLFATMAPIIIFLIIFSKYIILIIAGEKYLDATVILQIYLARSLIMIFQQQSSNTLISMGKSKTQFIMSFISIITKTCLVYLGIKYLGIKGAAIGSIFLTISNFIAWLFIMKKETGIRIIKILGYSLNLYQKALSRSFYQK